MNPYVKFDIKEIPLELLRNFKNRDINSRRVKQILNDLLNGKPLIEPIIVRYWEPSGYYVIQEGGHRYEACRMYNDLGNKPAITRMSCQVITDDTPDSFIQTTTYYKKNPTLEELLSRPAIHNLDLIKSLHMELLEQGFYEFLKNKTAIVGQYGRLTGRLLLFANGVLEKQNPATKAALSSIPDFKLIEAKNRLIRTFNLIRNMPVFRRKELLRVHYQILAYALSFETPEKVAEVYANSTILIGDKYSIADIIQSWRNQKLHAMSNGNFYANKAV